MKTRTRSEVKWLVNEAAALAGELERLDTQLAEIARKRDHVQKAHDACTRTLAVVISRPKGSLALPVVRVHHPYGGRGNLRQFIESTLQQAPEGLSAREIAFLVRDYFGLEFVSDLEFTQYIQNSIRPQLDVLRDEGLVENLPAAKPKPLLWAWKKNPYPALEDLCIEVDLPRVRK